MRKDGVLTVIGEPQTIKLACVCVNINTVCRQTAQSPCVLESAKAAHFRQSGIWQMDTYSWGT